MRVAVAADEALPVVDAVVRALAGAGAEVALFGPPAGGDQEWVEASAAAAHEVASGRAELGVVMCWSGTGASIAANKVPGVRAALCTDAATARMAREFNRANVLALSMRLTTDAVAAEVVAAFLDEPEGTGDFNDRNLAALAAVDGAPDLPWPPPGEERPELWWEDMPVGWTFTTPAVAVSQEALVGFARRYDPQPFHLDPEAATGTVFGALVGSGWHMTAITMRLFADHGPRVHGGVVGLGVEELRWAALHPGRSLHLEGEVIEARRSRSQPARGVVRLRVRTMAGRDEVQHMLPALLVPVRTPA